MLIKDHVELKNGQKFPTIGFGTSQPRSATEDIKLAVNIALETGYRHIDTAFAYRNERAIGEVLEEWLNSGKLKREELVIVTKLPSVGVRASDVERYLKESLRRLKLDYVDLYLVHCPAGLKPVDDSIDSTFQLLPDGNVNLDMETDLAATWKAMEDQVDAGRARAIGISNFNCAQVEKIMKTARISPATNQVELHAYFSQKPLQDACAKHGIRITAFAPLGSPGNAKSLKSLVKGTTPVPGLLENPVISAISKKHNKTNAQTLLRHLVQQNITVIPKSTTPARIKENFNIMDFELDVDDMTKINGLDLGADGRTFYFLFFPGLDKHPEYPFGAPF